MKRITSNKLLVGIIIVLGVALIIQTCHILGQKRRQRGIYGAYTDKMQKSPFAGTRKKCPVMQPKRITPGRTSVADYDTDAWDPFAEMQRMQKTMNNMFKTYFNRAMMYDNVGMMQSLAGFEPEVDLIDEDNAYIVMIDLPGVNKDAVDIEITPDSLTISGERSIETEEEDQTQGFYRSERSFGSFSRTVALPADVEVDEASADMQQGVLIVTLPKKKSEQAKIPIKIPVGAK